MVDWKLYLPDSLIAELFGIELSRGLADLPVLQRIETFRENFEHALEEELERVSKGHYEEMLEILKTTYYRSIIRTLLGNGADKLQRRFSQPLVDYSVGDDSNSIKLTARVFIPGRPVNREEARSMQDVVEQSRLIQLDSVDGAYLQKNGYAKVRTFGRDTPQNLLAVVSALPYYQRPTHYIEAVFHGQTPKNILPIVYENQKQLERQKPNQT